MIITPALLKTHKEMQFYISQQISMLVPSHRQAKSLDHPLLQNNGQLEEETNMSKSKKIDLQHVHARVIS